MLTDLLKWRDLAMRYTAAWCSQNPVSVAALYSHDGSLTVNDDLPAVRRNAIIEVPQSFMTAFPDLCVVMDDLVLQSDSGVWDPMAQSPPHRAALMRPIIAVNWNKESDQKE